METKTVESGVNENVFGECEMTKEQECAKYEHGHRILFTLNNDIIGFIQFLNDDKGSYWRWYCRIPEGFLPQFEAVRDKSSFPEIGKQNESLIRSIPFRWASMGYFDSKNKEEKMSACIGSDFNDAVPYVNKEKAKKFFWNMREKINQLQ